MKRSLVSGLTVLFAGFAIASAANAKPLNFNSAAADYNGDGVVTMFELHLHHLDTQTN
ncbi:MAG: hypothetical protein AB8B99_12660 [Phormidesmis sp.]